MKYETPQLTVLTLAVDAIQGLKDAAPATDGVHDVIAAYEDWE